MDWAGERSPQQAGADREARRKVRALKRELQRRESAPAETACLSRQAALLTLSKKARAIWGEDEHPATARRAG